MSQAERFAEFQTRAEDVKRGLEVRRSKAATLLKLQLNAAIKAPAVVKKVHWLRMGSQTIADAMHDVVACKAGCDSCCHVPVLMLASEAKVIGKAIGVPPVDVSPEKRDPDQPSWRGKDYPCPFLRNSLCSIREHRPLACRTLFNVDRDDYLCRHEEAVSMVPYLDMRDFEFSMALALHVPGDYIAELRDFFPTGLMPS